ncbi:MAG TPA: outer membrane lipoprotein carrier protein LolA [Acidobacteriota bacterium]|nr:outer membrane lipoprotein carrier protein LolA [Acidobacteriota bacterium]HNT16916.1 outer membrane lipoprotein carrier protein LolA [Acidobacteriota bacterium]
MVKRACIVFILLLPLLIMGKGKDEECDIKKLLDSMQKFQEKIETLKVSFVQVNDFEMLKKPEVLKGEIYIKKPSTALYLYQAPEKLYYLIKDGELMVYNPKKKEANVQDISRYQNKIMKYMGVSTPFAELEKKFDVKFVDKEGDIVHLSFTPQKKSMAKRLASLEFWVNEKDNTIRAMEIAEPEGDKVKFEFSNWDINAKFDQKVFDIDLPKGTKVKREKVSLKNPAE